MSHATTPHATGTVGLIGLGLVGMALAHRLQAAGLDVLGYDLREEARAAAARQGLRTATTAQALGNVCHTVVLAVFDTQGVLACTEGPQGLLTAGTEGAGQRVVQGLIDCSTGNPALLEPLAARLQAQGVAFVEAPLSGSSQQIQDGNATMLLGGSSDALALLEPVLQVLSSQRIHVGGAGAGAKAKLATNLVLGLNRAALAEGMVLAESMGIAPAQFLALVLATPARSDAALAKGAMMVSGDFTPQSRIRQHLKDVDLMLDHGQQHGQRLPLSQTHAALMRAAIAAGDGDLDNAAIIRELRRQRLNPKD